MERMQGQGSYSTGHHRELPMTMIEEDLLLSLIVGQQLEKSHEEERICESWLMPNLDK